MRTSGLCLAFVATAQFALFSSAATSAFAADPSATTSVTSNPATVTPVPSTTTTTTTTTTADGTVMVHLKSDKPVTLQRRSGESGSWETVCSSPCDVAAPVGDQYQVTGEGVNPSKPFMLNSSKGVVKLDVEAGQKKDETKGIVFLVVGGALVIAGIIVIAVAGGTKGGVSGQGNDSGTTHLGNTNAIFAGGGLIFAGLGAGIYGGATYLNSKSSTVEGDVAKPGPARGAVDPGRSVATNATPNVPTFVFPVWQGTF
jgi:hypothetical protein